MKRFFKFLAKALVSRIERIRDNNLEQEAEYFLAVAKGFISEPRLKNIEFFKRQDENIVITELDTYHKNTLNIYVSDLNHVAYDAYFRYGNKFRPHYIKEIFALAGVRDSIVIRRGHVVIEKYPGGNSKKIVSGVKIILVNYLHLDAV